MIAANILLDVRFLLQVIYILKKHHHTGDIQPDKYQRMYSMQWTLLSNISKVKHSFDFKRE